MTDDEARVRVALAIRSAPRVRTPNFNDADAALKAFGIPDWKTAAALMSGESAPVQRALLRAMEIVLRSRDQRPDEAALLEAIKIVLAASPASEKEHGDG